MAVFESGGRCFFGRFGRMMIRPYGIVVVENGRVDGNDIVAFRVHQRIDYNQGDGDEHHHDDVVVVEDGVSDRNH